MKRKNTSETNMINKMELLYNEAVSLWEVTEGKLLSKLITWTEKFNTEWVKMKGIVVALSIYISPRKLVNDIIETYESDLDLNM